MTCLFPSRLLLLLTGFCLATSACAAATLAIKAGKLIDPLAGNVLSDQVIIVENDLITAVGPAVKVPPGATVIDLSRQTVLPGLIDCHTHLLDETDMDPRVELQKSAAQKALEAIPHARHTLEAGFTTVRDVGTYRAFTDIALRDAIARGDVVGPRMFVAGAYITIAKGGGAITGLAPDIALPPDLQFGQADGPWEVRKRVRELANRGVDLIKVIATGAVLTHGSKPTVTEFTPEELLAAVDEAGRFGLKVAAHAHAARGIKDSITAGVASIEHGSLLDDQCIELMKQHGTYLVPDIYVDDFIQEHSAAMPAEFVEHDKQGMAAQRAGFSKAVKAGVKIAFGTDAGVFPHGQNGRQFKYYVRFGMTPMQAICSATIDAAALIGKQDLIGSITPGKRADIIAVPHDPLADISSLENVSFVMKDGKIFKQPNER